MRKVAAFERAEDARCVFARLMEQNIDCQLDENDQGRFEIWVRTEDQLIQAKQIVDEFLERGEGNHHEPPPKEKIEEPPPEEGEGEEDLLSESIPASIRQRRKRQFYGVVTRLTLLICSIVFLFTMMQTVKLVETGKIESPYPVLTPIAKALIYDCPPTLQAIDELVEIESSEKKISNAPPPPPPKQELVDANGDDTQQNHEDLSEDAGQSQTPDNTEEEQDEEDVSPQQEQKVANANPSQADSDGTPPPDDDQEVDDDQDEQSDSPEGDEDADQDAIQESGFFIPESKQTLFQKIAEEEDDDVHEPDPEKLKPLPDPPPEKTSRENELKQQIDATPIWVGFYNVILHYDHREMFFQAPLFYSIRHGEVWRLFSPILLHAGLLHFLFNMLWLWVLGRSCEANMGATRYVAFILVTAAITNTLQYLMTGPFFMGISGVLAAQAGYIWIRKKIAPWEIYFIDRGTLIFLACFIFGLFGLQIVAFYIQLVHNTSILPLNFANTAHVAGVMLGLGFGATKLFQRTL